MNKYIKRFLTLFALAFVMLFATTPTLLVFADDNVTHSTNQTEENTDLDAENGSESGNLPETEETLEQDEPTEESPEDGAEVLPEEPDVPENPTKDTPSEPDVPEEPTEEPDEETPEENTGFNIEDLAAKFNQYLKDKCGADYENIYNGIIEQWGSVEAYLLQFGQGLPEEQQDGWFAFLGWLHDYSVIWVPILALMLLVCLALLGKKVINKFTNSKVQPLVEELNKQSKAQAAMCDAIKTLLPKMDKYAAEAEKLDEVKKELTE